MQERLPQLLLVRMHIGLVLPLNPNHSAIIVHFPAFVIYYTRKKLDLLQGLGVQFLQIRLKVQMISVTEVRYRKTPQDLMDVNNGIAPLNTEAVSSPVFTNDEDQCPTEHADDLYTHEKGRTVRVGTSYQNMTNSNQSSAEGSQMTGYFHLRAQNSIPDTALSLLQLHHGLFHPAGKWVSGERDISNCVKRINSIKERQNGHGGNKKRQCCYLHVGIRDS